MTSRKTPITFHPDPQILALIESLVEAKIFKDRSDGIRFLLRLGAFFLISMISNKVNFQINFDYKDTSNLKVIRESLIDMLDYIQWKSLNGSRICTDKLQRWVRRILHALPQ